MGKFKAVTHYLALGLGSIVAFAVSPAGQAVIAQYPKLSGIVAVAVGIATAAGVYHQPKVVPPPAN